MRNLVPISRAIFQKILPNFSLPDKPANPPDKIKKQKKIHKHTEKRYNRKKKKQQARTF